MPCANHFSNLLRLRIVKTTISRAVHHGPRRQYRSNRTEYRVDRIEICKNFQTVEKARSWLGFWWFLDGIDRLDAIYLFKTFRTNEKWLNRSIGSVDRSIDRIDRWPPCSVRLRIVKSIQLTTSLKRLYHKYFLPKYFFEFFFGFGWGALPLGKFSN